MQNSGNTAANDKVHPVLHKPGEDLLKIIAHGSTIQYPAGGNKPFARSILTVFIDRTAAPFYNRSMRVLRVLVFTRREIFHKFATFAAPWLEAELADEGAVGEYLPRLHEYAGVFLRSKNEALLRALAGVAGTPILDPPAAVEQSLDRHRASTLAAAAGVPVPEELLAGKRAPWPVVVKNRIDRGDNRVRLLAPAVWNRGGHTYGQRFLKSDWEYKVYLFGRAVFTCRQRPTLFFPDKLATREPVAADPELLRLARAAARAVGLSVASLDFLQEEGQYLLTDCNPTPGLQHLPGGYGAVLPELLHYLDRGGRW